MFSVILYYYNLETHFMLPSLNCVYVILSVFVRSSEGGLLSLSVYLSN